MKKIVVLVTALLLIAGCTATPGGTAPATTPDELTVPTAPTTPVEPAVAAVPA